MSTITQLFTKNGGCFITPEVQIQEKLSRVKAFVFDWDGVFTNGSKDANLNSSFNEVDSMGTNLLRFSYFLKHQTLPCTAIISGEKNSAAFTFVERECFHYSFSKFANKLEAIHKLCALQNIEPHQIGFVFDDVLDLSLAEICGVRVYIPRKANTLLTQYVIQHKLADYITGCEGGNHAVREATELLISLQGNFEEVITKRKNFDTDYNNYLSQRKNTTPQFFASQNGQIVDMPR